MIRKRQLASILVLSTLAVFQAVAIAQASQVDPIKTGYAPVDGLKLYYEIYGTGRPLVLLHGGAGSLDMFSQIVPELSRNREVIAVDLQAHGRTADINRPLTYQMMAEDVAALITFLGFRQVDVMGYSLGGEVALRTAIQHPQQVSRLVLVSTAFSRSGWYPEILDAEAHSGPEVAEQMKQTPMYQLYVRTAPKPENWPILLGKLRDLLTQDYDWSDEVRRLQTPTLLIFGDADAIQTAHAVKFFELLGGGQRDGGWDGSGISRTRLAILPGLTHYTVFASASIVPTAVQFLDAPQLSRK